MGAPDGYLRGRTAAAALGVTYPGYLPTVPLPLPAPRSLLLAFALFCVTASAHSQRAPADFTAYADSVRGAYAGPDAHILGAGEVAGFHGVHFFAYDSAARVEARFLPMSGEAPVAFPTSSGRVANYRPIGRLMFALYGTPCRLTVYQGLDEHSAADPPFVPSTDATSGDETYGDETYGGGRYMDLLPIRPGQTTVTLDFNFTYHPYCAYSDGYSCPVPPAENALPVAVRAGVRSWFAPLRRS